jgi:beta-lactamase regulating signal transducer with metallopeptidase domain/parvulin-like peptidyl-prolyl isomerase
MTGFSPLLLMIVYKSSLILGIVTAMTFLAGRLWTHGCSVWKRVGIAGLLILPFAVCILPTISIPVLSPPTRLLTDNEGLVASRDLSRSVSTSRDSEEREFNHLLREFQTDASNVTPEVHRVAAPPLIDDQHRSAGHALIISLIGIYGFVVSLLLTRLISAWHGLRGLRRTSSTISDRETLALLAKWTRALNVRRPVAMRISNETSIPMTFGWCSPVILVPRDCLLRGDRVQKEAILIHELTHIANADYLWQILTQLMTALYWFHPLAWLVRRDAEILRERLCDRFCSQHLGRETYAQALIQIAARSVHASSVGLGMAMAERSSLRRRLNDLDARDAEPRSRSGRIRQALVIGMASGALGLVVLGMLTVRVPISKSSRADPKKPASRDNRDERLATSIVKLPQSINGMIRDEYGIDVPHATVTLRLYRAGDNFDENGTPPTEQWTASTNENGSYTLLIGEASLSRDDDLTMQVRAAGYVQQVSFIDSKEAVAGVLTTSQLKAEVPNASNDWIDWEDDTQVFNSQVAATVNGFPILNGAVLDRYAGYLISVREQMQTQANDPKKRYPGEPVPTVEKFQKFREMLIQRDIATHIQKVAVVQFLKADSTPDQLVQIDIHIDELFKKEIERLKRDLNVTTMTELEQELRNKGTTLQNVKESFALERMAVECLVAKSDPPPIAPVEAAEVHAYYDSHGELFLELGTVKWQRFRVSHSLESDDATARKKLEQLQRELNQAGSSDFDEIVQKLSTDPIISKLFYEETQAGSFYDVEFDGKLFTMPLNQCSEVIERPGSLSVIRVTERQETRRKAVEEVQDEIREKLMEKLREEQNKNRPKKLLKKIFSTVKIETQYSLPNFVPDEPSPVLVK